MIAELLKKVKVLIYELQYFNKQKRDVTISNVSKYFVLTIFHYYFVQIVLKSSYSFLFSILRLKKLLEM